MPKTQGSWNASHRQGPGAEIPPQPRKITPLKIALGALLLTCLASHALADVNAVGIQSLKLADTQNQRPLDLIVWYPTAAKTPAQMIADDVVFVGAAAVRDAPPVAGEHPLVVLSHGYRGNWGNQIWLANALAEKGYIVAAVNHPGTTTHDRSPQAAAQLWQRPVDVGRAIEAVTSQPAKFGAVAQRQIAVVGHSLGGWTALEIAGARFDPDLFDRDCETHPQLSSCTNYRKINPASTPALKAHLASDLRDQRVTAVVSLDLGLSRGMTNESLATLPVPVLVIAAGAPSMDLPAQLESANLAQRLPSASSRYVEITDASHFSFLQRCKTGAVDLLEEDVPGDSIICADGVAARPREVIQQQATSLISEFLQQSWRQQDGLVNR